MGHWGKRQALAVFMSVWVVGCSSTQEAAPSIPPTITPAPTLVALSPSAQAPPSSPTVPIPTPLPPPTAVAYAIQAGDTLLGIARQFGVPVATLEAANSGLNPLALPIGATLMIPAPIFDAAGRPILPSATPAPIQAGIPLCSPTPTGMVVCLGQIINRLPQPVGRVIFSVRLFGRDGRLLGETRSGLEQSLIPSGSSAPYRVLVAANWREVQGSGITILSADAEAAGARYLPVVIDRETVSEVGEAYTVLARVRLSAGERAHLRRAVLTLYDANGRVIGFRVLPLDTLLKPNDTFALQISAAVLDGMTAAQHTLYVEAERAAP